MKGVTMPTMPPMPTLKSLAELPDVPSPVLALVGAGDAAAQAAKDLPGKLAAVDPKSFDPREAEVAINLSSLDPRKIDLTALGHKIDPRNIDTAALTATGLQWAAKSQETYEHLVARGEAVVSKARSSEWADVADEVTVVAEPPAKKTAAKKSAAQPAAQPAAGPADTTGEA